MPPATPPAAPSAITNEPAFDPDRFEPDGGFVVSTGIECSAPRIAGGVRREELRLTGHWERYAEDIALVASLGIRYLRYGVPFHVIAADPRHLDWAWTDAAMDALRRAGVEPVADLIHFGVPDDLAGFGDARLPDRYRGVVEAFTRRYPWVRWFTPVNEPFITADFSAGRGWWNERATGDTAMVAALANTVECAVDGMAIIRAARPDAVFLQSDVCESFLPSTPEAEDEAAFLADRRFVAFELAYGRLPGARVTDWLVRNGFGEGRLARVLDAGSPDGCIVGLDYYQHNEHLVTAAGEVLGIPPEAQRGFAAVAREYHDRLRLPFMLAETNATADGAPAWLAALWNDAVDLRAAGLPIRGFCWYSLTDQVDWNTCLREPAGHVDSLGLVDLDRRLRPVGSVYRDLALAARTGRISRLPAPATRPAPAGLGPEADVKQPALAEVAA